MTPSTPVGRLVHFLRCVSCSVKLHSGRLRVSPPSSRSSQATVLPRPAPLGAALCRAVVIPVIVKGMGGGSVSFILWSVRGLCPQDRAKQRGFGSCHSSPSCSVGFRRPPPPAPGRAGIGACGMDRALSLQNRGLSSLRPGGDSAVPCLPGLPLGLEF